MTQKSVRSPKDLLLLTYGMIALSPIYYFVVIVFGFYYAENVTIFMMLPLGLVPAGILLAGLLTARKSVLFGSMGMLMIGLSIFFLIIYFYWGLLSLPIRSEPIISKIDILLFAVPRGLFAVFPFLFTGIIYFSVWVKEAKAGNYWA